MPVLFLSKLDPQNRGYFKGGRRHFCTNLRPQSSRTPPIFSRTERVLAESPATLRESYSSEMTKKAKAILSVGQDLPLTISFPAQSMPAWSTSGGDCGSIMTRGPVRTPLRCILSAEMWSKRLFPYRNMQPPPSPLHPPLGVSLVSLCDLSHAQTNPLRVSGIEHADKGSGGPCAAVHSPVWPFHLSFTTPPSHKPRSRPCTHPAQPLQFALISLQGIHQPPPPLLAHLPSCHPPCSKPSTLRLTSPSPLPSPPPPPPSRSLQPPAHTGLGNGRILLPPSRSRLNSRPNPAAVACRRNCSCLRRLS